MQFHDVPWSTFSPHDRATMLFVVHDEQVLLIRKLRGLGAGKIVGPGGRLDLNETPLEAAIRETQEELLITPTDISTAGELLFQFVDGYKLECHIFKARSWQGSPTATEEAIPLWFPLTQLPFEQMWADDPIWFPLMLANVPFFGCALFDGDQMLAHNIAPGTRPAKIY
jgi:8-oxo-dGTP diphosphatase